MSAGHMIAGNAVMRAQSAPWHAGVECYLFDREQRVAVKDFVFEPMVEGAYRPSCLRLSQDAAQTLMDDLWNCGIRPTEGAGTAGAMRATERHLADMRAIAFNKLKCPTP